MTNNPLTSMPLRATLSATAAMLAAAALLVALIGWHANRAFAQRTLATLEAEVADLGALYRRGGADALAARIIDLSTRPGADFYALDTGDGRRLAGPASLPPAAALADGQLFTFRVKAGVDHLAIARLIRIPHEGASPLTLVVARDIEDQRRLAREIQWTAFGGLALLSLMALAFGLIARRALLTRVATITTASRAIMAGDLARRIPRDGPRDEIDQLADNLNAMLARIEGLMQALRDVSDNIAHDLRTPLNRLRNTAEAALRATPDTSATARQDALGKIIEEADSLIQTFNALLLIARLEPGMADDQMERLDVAPIVADAVDLYAPLAEEAGLELRVSLAPAELIRLRGNRQLLGQALVNLLDNAVKYAAPTRTGVRHGPIDVIVEPHHDHVDIIVADRGPGIPMDDRERALKRFVRLESSRTKPGTGLGLSLVAAVARLHAGKLILADNTPGLRAILSLPRIVEQPAIP